MRECISSRSVTHLQCHYVYIKRKLGDKIRVRWVSERMHLISFCHPSPMSLPYVYIKRKLGDKIRVRWVSERMHLISFCPPTPMSLRVY